mgnify:FL=1
MFYYNNWDKFCKAIVKSGVHVCSAEVSLKLSTEERFIVLKHDVETSVINAYKLAAIEHKYGICGSYYVQAYLMLDRKNICLLKEMQSWGHEISYHYDVLDAHEGDYKAAEEDFIKYSNIFLENGFHYSTICQHGNPIKKRVGYTSNRDFFRNPKIRSHYPDLVDMVVDYSKHIGGRKYRYISDAGYQWNIITEPETNDLHPEVKNVKIGDFKNLLNLLINSEYSYVVSTHPHRWMSVAWKINLKIIIFRIIREFVMIIRHIPGIEWLLNKFYFLAKKI